MIAIPPRPDIRLADYPLSLLRPYHGAMLPTTAGPRKSEARRPSTRSVRVVEVNPPATRGVNLPSCS